MTTLNIHEGLSLDPASTAREIERFVQSEVARLGKRGVVLGLSGGLDSSVCAYLCARALGRRNVLAFILPERDSNPQNTRDAVFVAQILHLQVTHIDVSPILTQLGAYDYITREQAGNRSAIETGLRWIVRLTGQPSAFSAGLASLYSPNPGWRERLARKLAWRQMGRIYAFAITKARARMIVLYHHAMLNNCLLVGTADKSEFSIGFYDRYGDGAHDVALLRHLYKTQIRDLARYLGVPPQIVNKPSSGDLAAGLPNEAFIGLNYEQLDGILWGIEHDLPDEQIIAQLKVAPVTIRTVRKTMEVARLIASLPSHL